MGERSQMGMLFHAPQNNNSLCTAIKASFYPTRWAISNQRQVRKTFLNPCGEDNRDKLIFRNQHTFWIKSTRDARSACKPNTKIVDEHKNMFESLISAGTIERLRGWETSHEKVTAWCYDTEGHAKKRVERYSELANKEIDQFFRVSTPCVDDHQFKKGDV